VRAPFAIVFLLLLARPLADPAPGALRHLRLPLAFEPNRGQADPQAQFLSRAGASGLFLASGELVVSLPETAVRMKLVGAASSPKARPEQPLPGRSHYFLGSDPTRWRTDVPHYGRVRYQAVYPGVDLVYYGSQGQLEYDFVVAPGADPSRIRLRFDGAHPALSAGGDLVLENPGGEVRLRQPVAYQQTGGARREVAAGFRLDDEGQVSFVLGDYDPGQPLVIDPVLSYSSYLGASGGSAGEAIAVDDAGNIYVTGATGSNNFPTASAMQSIFQGSNDVFLTKLSPDGAQIIFSTFLGSRGHDIAFGMALDAAGNIYLTGSTSSPDFPTLNAAQKVYAGGITGTGGDVFVTKLNPAGSAILYSTFLGGTDDEIARSIAVDSAGSAYITGYTVSQDFPLVNALQAEYGGGTRDAFVFKLNPAGNAVVYSTYLGAALIEEGNGIAVDAQGQAHVTGFSTSPEFFPTHYNLQTTYAGGVRDAFVSKLNASGTAFIYSTYLGGTSFDEGNAVAIDSQGNAVWVGATQSTNFFRRVNAIQATHGGGTRDFFILKMDPEGDEVIFSTYFGGSLVDEIPRVKLDSHDNIYLMGSTNSTNFPTAAPFQATNRGGTRDLVIVKLTPTGFPIFSTYLGGTLADLGRGLAVDSTGNAWVTGNTLSTNFPVVQALQRTYTGGGPAVAFVSKIVDELGDAALPANPVLNGASFAQNTPVAPGSIVAIFGTDLASATQIGVGLPLPGRILDTSVTFNGIQAPLFFVSRTQVNAQIPYEIPLGTAMVQVRRGETISAAREVNVVAAAPGLFTTNRQGTGAGVIVHATDFRQATNALPARPGGYLAIFCTGLGRLKEHVPTGNRPPSPPPEAIEEVEVRIADRPAKVTFAGVAPGFVALYQVNVQVPDDLPTGSQPLEITVNGLTSNRVTVPIGARQ